MPSICQFITYWGSGCCPMTKEIVFRLNVIIISLNQSECLEIIWKRRELWSFLES